MTDKDKRRLFRYLTLFSSSYILYHIYDDDEEEEELGDKDEFDNDVYDNALHWWL